MRLKHETKAYLAFFATVAAAALCGVLLAWRG
jgi:hypothetical protein